jgi:hypothetical protein
MLTVEKEIVMKLLQADANPALIGSLPHTDHEAAIGLVMDFTPEIPIWVQLPRRSGEGMVEQFMAGLPSLRQVEGRWIVDTASESFDSDILQFYEEYLAVTEGNLDLMESRFCLLPESAPGFFVFEERLRARIDHPPLAVKGQVTGPITFTTGIRDQDGKAIFYHEQLRDVAVKLLAWKARWQVRRLSRLGLPVIIFIDEPAMAGFGSSEFIGMERGDVETCFNEVIGAIHEEGGVAGVHVCANTDWSLLLGSGLDIVNFDAYGYFDRFVLYREELAAFLKTGGILAWGIVPTGDAEAIEKCSVSELYAKWEGYLEELESLGIDRLRVYRQSLITPSCGAGSLSIPYAEKVLQLTRDLADMIQKRYGNLSLQ